MGVNITVSDLTSRIVRTQTGQRIFKASFHSSQTSGNLISYIWEGGKRIVGIIGSILGGIGFSFTAIWSLIVSTTQYIWNFNWNITDTEIDNQIKQLWNATAGLLGGNLGNAFGYLACGVIPSATIMAFNEPMGAYILKNVAEEMKDEIVGNLSNLINYTFKISTQSLLLISFKNGRKWLKSNPAFFNFIFGEEKAKKIIDAWGSAKSKPWSFAKATDDAVESIPNQLVQNFVEEFLEEAWDGCVEAGYVVANSLDTYIAQQKLNNQINPVNGPTRYVEITPDRSNDREKIILAGNEQPLKNAIVQTLSHYQLIENRDVGSLVGMPADDYLRARPQTIRIVVSFFNVQSPPFTPPDKNTRLVKATYAIPDLKRSKCNWNDIKLACGGQNGYMWGRYRCTGLLDNGRQMQVMGSTPDEAEDMLRQLLTLSEAKLVKKPTISEDRQEDVTGKYIKQPTRVFPAFFTIMNQYKIAGGQGSGVKLSDGVYNRKNDKILLWTMTEPYGTEERIAEMLLRPGLDT